MAGITLHDAKFSKIRRDVTATAPEQVAQPTARVLRLRRETCQIYDCADAGAYLDSRHLWPVAAESTLKAHVSVEYFQDGQKLGRYPALIADVRDIHNDIVSTHITYLSAGRKLRPQEPRKLLSPVNGREGCAVRLAPIAGEALGIGEGIETCLAAALLHSMPVWAALNTTLLAKFTPPPEVKRLVIFADRDIAGLSAAARLMERLQGRITMELRTPPVTANDWADVLAAQHQRKDAA